MSGPFQTTLQASGGFAWWLAVACLMACMVLLYRLFRLSARYRAALEENQHHQELIDNLSEGIYRSSPDGRQLSANPSLVKLNGYTSEDELLASVGDIATEWYVDPERRNIFRRELERHDKVENFISEIYRHKTRERIWISESARLVRDRRSGAPLYYEGSVREITETVKRLKLQDLFEKLTSQLPGGLFQMLRRDSGEFQMLYSSAGLRRLLGYRDASIPEDPNTVLHMVHADDRAHYLDSLRESGRNLNPWECEFRIRTADGKDRWLRVSATPETTDQGIVWHGYLADISVRKKNEMEIEQLAFYDPLTRLPNRRLLFDQVRRQMSVCSDSGKLGAILFIDLDNFKTLNDTMGHDVGDEFLKQVSERLQAAIAPNDTVGRIGGDEFVIVLQLNDKTAASATRNAIVAANRVLAALRQEFTLGQMNHHTSASVGVLVFNGREKGPEVLMKNADMAMYQAKNQGRNNVALFDPEVLQKEHARFRLLSDMRSALVENRLEMHYQPQVNTAGHVIGAEALLRWKHADHGKLSPSDFVALAEQHGLAELLGRGVIESSLRTLAAWKKNPRLSGLRMAVNISLKSLRDPEFLDFLHDRLDAHAVAPQRLTLEMTERVLTSDQLHISRRMNELKALGVRLSLDDFGTGYSSIAYLKKLPFDELKIDGSFIAELEENESNRALVQTMLNMASTLGLSAVAEHVQTPQQEALLKTCGCTFFQGWLYGRAMTGRDFTKFVLERNPASILKFPNSLQGA
ncbi:EAL domain-containing protein [Nitratireductor sp. GISD-1A_MAKvit]|uniref:sensor domain-containing protein n=1 Tax=Nitratireductor sp. GISD-1A_MAKvit TaxID=3234198 RepID=UPI0034671E72